MILTIKVLDSEAYYQEMLSKQERGEFTGDLKLLSYDPDLHYTQLEASPFKIQSSVTDVDLYETYQDISKGGLATTSNTNITYWPTSKYVSSNDEFVVDVYPKDIFNQLFVQLMNEDRSTEANSIIMIDFFNHKYKTEKNSCIKGSEHSKLSKFCNFLSFSHQICASFKMCHWVPAELDYETTFRN